ncbi:HD-GYP domain-containing protein [Rossellomorea sp. H39__3]
MKIKRQDARVGHLVSEDIMGMTSVPLIMKGTVLTDQHIRALRAFNVQELTIESVGDLLKASPPVHHEARDEQKVEISPFLTRYMKSVEDYKKEFVKWQSGMAVDIAKIREILLSVLAEVQESPTLIHTVIQVQSKPDYFYHHAMATALLSTLIGKKLGIDDTQSTQLGLGAALSNCGMAKISSIILKRNVH